MGQQVEPPVVRMHTICPDCGGSGARLVERAAATEQGWVGSLTEQQKCRTCNGQGRMPGMVPPV